MPRNKSEALPTCAAAHRYADACQAVLDGEDESVALWAWSDIPNKYMVPIDFSGPMNTRNWRSNRIRFIRETYGT